MSADIWLVQLRDDVYNLVQQSTSGFNDATCNGKASITICATKKCYRELRIHLIPSLT
jgi:hypothetical protein